MIEGIMMQNGENYAVAVRKPDGEIEVKKDTYRSVTKKYPFLGIPFIRGVFKFADSMMLWLEGKLPVPKVLHFERHDGWSNLLMSEADGVLCSEEYEDEQSPEKIIELYAECIRLFHSIDISDCPYTNSLDSRLAELDYLLNNDLADVDCENWEEDTPFKDPRELYDFLKTEKPEEELVFSHGDLGDSNIFVKDGKVSGFIDLGRSGRADKWYDIAFCVRSIREDIGEEQYVELFFDLLGIKPDWEKIKYYILLDELF